ncbi:MAG: hypothetical protein FWD87_10855 [Spirochaetaceae bacterium]|nr:hypothetical protein [Spirochaetaceae bacterium]
MARKISLFILIFLCFFSVYPVLTQEDIGALLSDFENSETGELNLPNGFMDILLGMNMDEVRERLRENSFFNYRGEPDVSMLLTRNQHLIETAGFSFIDRAFFQFYDGRLFIITLVLNRERLDFFTMFTNFEERYNRATRIDPRGAYWESSEVNLHLERPLTIKYMDRRVLEMLASERREVEDRGSRLREDFLDLF